MHRTRSALGVLLGTSMIAAVGGCHWKPRAKKTAVVASSSDPAAASSSAPTLGGATGSAPGGLLGGLFGGPKNGEPFTHRGPFKDVVAANNHTCVLSEDGSARCFGGDDSVLPTWRKTPATKFKSIATSHRFACGITESNSSIECWGDCVSDRCVAPAGAFLRFVLSPNNGGCGWTTDSSVICWGPDSVVRALSAEVRANVIDLAFGTGFGVAIRKDGSLIPINGQDPSIVVPVPAGSFKKVVANTTTACALTSAGNRIHCWRGSGAKPNPTLTGGGLPEFPGMRNVPTLALSADSYAGCMLMARGFGLAGGSAYCSGKGGGGTGAGGAGNLNGSFTRVANGALHACALTTSGDVTCWGRDVFSQVSGRGSRLW